MYKHLLKAYVWMLNRDPGTRVWLGEDDGEYFIHGVIRSVVKVTALKGTDPRELAQTLVILEHKAKELLATAGSIFTVITDLLDQGVSSEDIFDALDELGVQHKEGRV